MSLRPCPLGQIPPSPRSTPTRPRCAPPTSAAAPPLRGRSAGPRPASDRRTALADLTHAIVVAPPALRTGAAAAARELLPSLTDCERPARYLALISEADRDARAQAWQLRLAIAGAFAPRPTTRAPELPPADTSEFATPPQPSLKDPRSAHESNFAAIVQDLHAASPSLLRTPLESAVDLGRRTASTHHADLAARAWVLAAELLESQPHAEGAREEAWTAASAALEQLPPDLPLRLRLRRDLGFIELTHARHATPAGACRRGEADFAACQPLFAAITELTAVAADPSATAADHELLARAHDHAGDASAAAAVRARSTPIDLDERALGYLAPSIVTLPDAPDPTTQVRCTDDAHHCELARDYAALLASDPARLDYERKGVAATRRITTR